MFFRQSWQVNISTLAMNVSYSVTTDLPEEPRMKKDFSRAILVNALKDSSIVIICYHDADQLRA